MPVWNINKHVRLEASNFDKTALIESTFGQLYRESIIILKDDMREIGKALIDKADFLDKVTVDVDEYEDNENET